MAKNPPPNSALTVCESIVWTEHFQPSFSNVKEEARPSLRCIHPYPDLPIITHLCADSYNEKPEIIQRYPEWERLWSVSSDETGYFGAIYVNESAKQLVLAHRGTDLRKFKDWKADADICFIEISSRMLSAMTCTHQLKNKMKESFAEWKLIITGHSLGSYLTDVSIFSSMYLEPGEPSESGSRIFCRQNDVEDPRFVDILPYGIGIDGPGVC